MKKTSKMRTARKMKMVREARISRRKEDKDQGRTKCTRSSQPTSSPSLSNSLL
jgi:hypothetical protein